MLCLIYPLLAFAASCSGEPPTPLVETPLGYIVGSFFTSYNNKTFAAFEGIPYGKPPVGEKRFQEPEPVDPWPTTYVARMLIQCAQISTWDSVQTWGDEDCLRLNVYVPRETINPEERLDVLVHIHGGSFFTSDGFNRPILLMDREVIVVTVHFRLGIFGFLSTEDEVLPGNNGLKDQVLALKWIQSNIASFGGNPDSVTLMGSGTGAMSVHLHYFSAVSAGLFHRGFASSGVALNPSALVEGSAEKARKLGAALNCSTETSQEMVECLKSVTYEDVLLQIPSFLGYVPLPLSPFGPVVEKAGLTPFLAEHPYRKLVKGGGLDLPFLASNVLHEGWLVEKYFVGQYDYPETHWRELAPYLLDFNYTLDHSLWDKASDGIKTHYFGEEAIGALNYKTAIQLFTDRLFLSDADTAIKLQANVSASPVYYYTFGYTGGNNYAELVRHGDDMQGYIIGQSNDWPYTANELKMKDLMLDMLLAYANSSKPEFDGVEWEPVNSEELVYLNITGVEDGEIKNVRSIELGARSFWDSLDFEENGHLFV